MAGNRLQFTLQFNADTTQAKKAVNDLMNSLKDVMKHNSLSLNINADLIKGAEAAQELETHLRSAINVNTGLLNLVAFNKSLQLSGQSLSTLVTNLANAGSTGQQAFINLATAISQTLVPLRQTNVLINNMMTSLKNTVKWELSSSVVHGLEGALSGAVSYVKELNSSLTDIRIVTGQSVEDMSKFAVLANRAAKELSTTTKAYADASLIYYLQGDNQEQVAKKAAITIKAANASFNSSAAEMSEYLTAVWNSYRVGADELERYVDIMAALGAKTATSLEEIATSMQKVAATANTVGVSMEQVSSIIATVSSVTRESAESIGTSYKTIFARIGDLKLGKTLEDGVKLGQVSKLLNSIGISILDATGNLRDMGDIITDLGNKWQTMSSAEKTATAQIVAGKRQYTQLMALFENWDMYQENLGIAQNSEGSLEKMAKTYAESWEAASNRVKASMETIYSSLINDQAMIKITNIIAEITNGIGGFIKTLGGAKGLLSVISTILLNTFSGKIVSGVANMTNSITNLIKGPAKQYTTILKQTNKVLGDTADGQNKASILATSQLIALKQSLVEKEKYLTTAQQATMQVGLDTYAKQIAKLRELETAYEDIGADLDGLAIKLGKFGGALTDALLLPLIQSTNSWSLLLNKNFIPTSSKEGALTSQIAKNWSKASLAEGIADNALDMVSDKLLNNLDTAEQKISQFSRALEQLQQITKDTKLEKLFDNFKADKLASGELKVLDLRLAITLLSQAAETDAKVLNTALQKAINNPSLGEDLINLLKKIQEALSSGQIDATEAFAHLQQLFVDTEHKAEKLKNKLQSLPTTIQNITLSAAQITSGLWSAVNAGNAISGAFSMAGDEAYSTAEKVGSIVSATSMGVMGVVSMISAVRGLALAFHAAEAAAGWIGLIAGTLIAATVTAITTLLLQEEARAEKKAKELSERIKKQSETNTKNKEEVNDVKSLIHEYNQLYEQYKQGEDVLDELATSALKLSQAYGITAGAVAALTGDYEKFNSKLKEQIKLNDAHRQGLMDDYVEAKNNLTSAGDLSGNTYRAGYTTIAMSLALSKAKTIDDVIAIIGEDKARTLMQGYWKNVIKSDWLYHKDTYNKGSATLTWNWMLTEDKGASLSGYIDWLSSGNLHEHSGGIGSKGNYYLESLNFHGEEYGLGSGFEIKDFDLSLMSSVTGERTSYITNTGALLWDESVSPAQMSEQYELYETWYNELEAKSDDLTEAEKGLKEALSKIVKNENLTNAVTAFRDALKLWADYSVFSNNIDNFIGSNEATMDFANNENRLDFISFYQDLANYIDNNQGDFESLDRFDDLSSKEYIIARNALADSLIKDYTSFDDYVVMYNALVDTFQGENLTKAIDFVQQKGIKNMSELDTGLLNAMQIALLTGENLIGNALVESVITANKAITTALTSKTNYEKMSTNATLLSEDMNLDEASKFYDTYWNAGIEGIMKWEDFILLDYEGRKAYINSLTNDYLQTAKADAEHAESMAEQAFNKWNTAYTQLYGMENSKTRANWNNYANHYKGFLTTVMANYTQNEKGIYEYVGPEGQENTEYTYLLNARGQGINGAYNNYYKQATGSDVDLSEIGITAEVIEKYNLATATGVSLTEDWNNAIADMNGFDLIASGAESATTAMTRLVSSIKQLPTSGSELAKIAEALGWDINKLIKSTEAERAAAVAGMDKPKLKQSGVKKYADIWEYLDDHPELKGLEGLRIAESLWLQELNYSTDQDYADYAEQLRLYSEVNVLNAQYQEEAINNGAIETLSTIKELSSTLSSIDITNLPEKGSKSYELFNKALERTGSSMKEFMKLNDGAKYSAIAKAQNKLIDELITINESLQDYYASIMNDTTGAYDDDTRAKAASNYYNAVIEGNNLILSQEQNIANARASATKSYEEAASLITARMETAKSEAEELKTVAEVMADAIDTGELSYANQLTLSQAGYLDTWNNAATAVERAAIASLVWSKYAADTAKAGEELSVAYQTTANILANKDRVASYNDRSDALDKENGGMTLDLQNREDYLEYLRQWTDMTEEQIGLIGKAWDSLEKKGVNLSTMTNAGIKEALVQELVDMNVEVDRAWQIVAANAKDTMANIGKSMAQDHIEAAQKAADAWLSAFKTISEARKTLLSGGNLLEQIAGNPTQILQYARSANLSPQEVANQIMTGKLTAQLLNYDSYDNYIASQWSLYGLDQKTSDGVYLGTLNKGTDIYALGYSPLKINGKWQWADKNGNVTEQETINEALEKYYTAILKTAVNDEDEANKIAKLIISGDGLYETLKNAISRLIEAIEASKIAQERYTKLQEIKTEMTNTYDQTLKTQTAQVANGSGNQEELTKLLAALQKALTEKNKEDGKWENLAEADRQLLAQYGITSFDLVDSAAVQCATALSTLATAAYEAAKTLVSLKAQGAGYYEKDGLYYYDEKFENPVTEINDLLKQYKDSADLALYNIFDVKTENINGLASSVGMIKDEFEAYTQAIYDNIGALEDWSSLSEEAKKPYYDLAREIAEADNAFKDLQSISKDTWKQLKSGANKGSVDYIKSIQQLKKNMSKIFHTDMKYITDDFVENHLDQMEKMATGTKKEAMAAQDAIEDDLVKAVMEADGTTAAVVINVETGEAESALTYLQNALDLWDGEEFGFTIHADTEGAQANVIASLNSILSAGQMTADLITAALNAIGWEPEITWKKFEGSFEDAQTAHGYIKTLSGYQEIGEDIRGTYTGEYYLPVIGSATKKSSSGGGPRKSSSGGGGGSKPKTLDKKKPEDEKERYHYLNEQLKRLNESFTETDKLKDRTYGNKHLKNLEQEISLLKEQLDVQRDYIKAAKEYLAIDQQRVASLGATFDADGNITNYEEVMDSIIGKYNDFIDRYNSASASQLENMEEEKKEWDEWYEEKIEWISQYEETLATVNEKQNDLLETQNKISEAMLGKIQYKVEVKVDINKDEQDLLDYLSEKYDEVIEKQGVIMNNLIRESELAQDNIRALEQSRYELELAFNSGNINQADYVEGLRDINEQLLDNLKTINDVKKDIEELYSDTIEDASKVIDKLTLKISNASEAMKSYISILQLLGKGQNYEDLMYFYEKQYDYNKASLQTLMDLLEVLKQEEKYYLDRIDSASGLTETERKQYEALQETMQDVQKEILSSTESTLQSLQEKYNNTINSIMKNLEESIVGKGNSLSWLSEEYSYYLEEFNRYLSAQKQLYEVNKLNRNIDKSIADTTETLYRKQLKQLQDEINAKAESNSLSEYELNIMNLKYELLLKQIALEEAQNAKSTVRLTRDSEGNMIYQYTADADEISKAQQEYEDVLQQMVDANYEQIHNVEQQTIETYQNMVDKIKEIASDETLTQEQKMERIAEIVSLTKDTLRYLLEQYNITSENLMYTNELVSERYNTALWEHSENAKNNMNTTIAEMIANTDKYVVEMQNACGNGGSIQSALEDYSTKVDEIAELTNTRYGDMIDAVLDYDRVTEDAEDETRKMANELRNNLLPQIHTTTNAWDTYYKTLRTSITQTEALISKNNALISSLAQITQAAQRALSAIASVSSSRASTSSGGGNSSSSGSGSGGTGGGSNINGYSVTVQGKGLTNTFKLTTSQYGSAEAARGTADAYITLLKLQHPEYKISGPTQYATGGLADYTGPAWLDGTKNKPELILNPEDTQNMFRTIDAVRQLDKTTLNIMDDFINFATSSMMANMFNLHAGSTNGSSGELQQNVQITAEFPNVQDRNEIEAAFDNLINRASQFIGSKGRP